MTAEANRSLGVGIADGVGGFLLALLRSLGSKQQESDAAVTLPQAYERLAPALGEVLLQARDRSDLARRVDEVLESDAFAELAFEMFPTIAKIDLEALEPKSTESAIAPLLVVFGKGCVEPLRKIDAVLSLFARASGPALDSAGGTNVFDDEAVRAHFGRPLWFFEDRTMPPRLVQALLDGRKAEVLALGIAEAVRRGKKLEPWRALALLEMLLQHFRGHMVVLSAIPGIEISEDLLPKNQQLDLADLEAQQRALARELAAADESDATSRDPKR